MDCARNIITANFSGGGTSTTTAPLWQWDYGQVLCITGIDLPAAFEVHFSTNRAGGVSTVAVGADGQVTIPNDLLTIGKNLNAWIYLSDAQGEGETEYSILIPVKARPMPETYDAEVSGEFDDVVRQVSEYAETAQTAADNAGASATAAAASADSAAASASAAETAKNAAETAQGKAEDAQAAAETAAQTATEKAQQSAQDAAQAALDAGRAESAAGSAEAAQTGAQSAKTDAETAAQGAADSASAASASATSAGQAATAAGQSATAAAGSATTAQGAAQTATTKAGEASASATVANTAKTAAQTAQAGAETAATNAGQSASTATAKAAEAAQSATDAAASETAAEAAATRAETAAANLVVDDALSDTSTNPVQNKVITGEVTQLKSALTQSNNEISRLYVIGKNLIDPVKIASNTILYSDGTTGTANGYNTCDFIPIESGQSITFSRIRQFMAYDTDKVVVSGSWYGDAYEKYTYTATEDGFVRASVANAYLSTWQAEYGASATPYEPYQRFLAIDLGETPLNQVADLIAETNATYLIEDITPSSGYTDNVFIRYDNGGTSGNSAYRATPQISLRQYSHVLYTRIQLASESAQSYMGMAFSSTSEYLSGQRRVSGSELKYIPTLIEVPENTSSARFSEHKSLTGFYVKGVRKVDVKDIAKNSNILFGKKWAVCGDSFTNGALTTKIGEGKYSNEKVVYPYLIGNRNEMTIVKFFEGGRTLAFPATPGNFTNSLTNENADFYYQNIPADVDYITIYLGINDEHHAPNSSGGDGEDNTGEIPIGTVDDNTVNTYLGAWNVVLTWLIANRPNAHIGMIVTNGNQSKDEYRLGQIAIAEKYGIPYIDMNGDARTPAMLRTSNPNIPSAIKQALIQKWAVDPSSNTHPNDAAHLFESHFIENFLRSI